MASTGSIRGRTDRVAGQRASTAIDGARIDVAVACVVVLLLVLGFARLDRFPAPWFDEGIHLQVAKNLVTDGIYAARSADGSLDYAPSIGVGPTLLLPTAGMLKMFGVNLFAARAAPVIYLILATVILFVITRSLFGRLAGFATLAIVLSMPALDWVGTGRQVLGEIPALALLLLGGLLVLRARSPLALLGAGFVVGLSLVTKGQYVLIVPATLIALAAIDWSWTRHRPIRWHATLFASVLGTWAIWIATLLLVIGDGNAIDNVRLLRESSSGALLVFDASRMAAAWQVVLGPSTLLLVLPSALAGLLAIRSSDSERRFALLALWLFQAAWLGWFVAASIGWPRYAFAGLAVNAIFAGHLVDRLLLRVRREFASASRSPTGLAASAACVLLTLLLLAGVWRTLMPLVATDGQDAERFVVVLDERIPSNAVIASWEPELGFLSDHAFQAPPPGSLNSVVNARWFGGAMPNFGSDLREDYLVVGPFARWVGVYRVATTSTGWQRIAIVGEYELYQRLASAAIRQGME